MAKRKQGVVGRFLVHFEELGRLGASVEAADLRGLYVGDFV